MRVGRGWWHGASRVSASRSCPQPLLFKPGFGFGAKGALAMARTSAASSASVGVVRRGKPAMAPAKVSLKVANKKRASGRYKPGARKGQSAALKQLKELEAQVAILVKEVVKWKNLYERSSEECNTERNRRLELEGELYDNHPHYRRGMAAIGGGGSKAMSGSRR